MGIMGACRANELHAMKIQDIKDVGSMLLVSVPNTKTKIARKFTINDKFYQICNKYINLRPTNLKSDNFFLNFQKGKLTSQKIGINKFSAMGKQIATSLNLPNPDMYTGHSFRRSSATLLVDAGGDITALKRHGGWRSTSVAEGYIDDSLENKMNTAKKIINSVTQNDQNPSPSTSHAGVSLPVPTITNEINSYSTSMTQCTYQTSGSHTTVNSTGKNEINLGSKGNSTPSINITNCSNITLNFYNSNN